MSGFVASGEPKFVQVPKEPQYTEEADFCMNNCGDSECREWANLKIVGDIKYEGQELYHISECQMDDKE